MREKPCRFAVQFYHLNTQFFQKKRNSNTSCRVHSINNYSELSFFDSFDVSKIKNEPILIKDVEPEAIVFEEGEELGDIWQCPKEYEKFPVIYDTEKIENKDKLVYRAFYIPSFQATWYLNELDRNTGEAFGLIAFQEVEWGYFSVKELFEIGAKEIPMEYPKTYEQLVDTELKKSLSKEELERAFKGQLAFEEDLWEKLPDEIELKRDLNVNEQENENKKKNGFKF